MMYVDEDEDVAFHWFWAESWNLKRRLDLSYVRFCACGALSRVHSVCVTASSAFLYTTVVWHKRPPLPFSATHWSRPGDITQTTHTPKSNFFWSISEPFVSADPNLPLFTVPQDQGDEGWGWSCCRENGLLSSRRRAGDTAAGCGDGSICQWSSRLMFQEGFCMFVDFFASSHVWDQNTWVTC